MPHVCTRFSVSNVATSPAPTERPFTMKIRASKRALLSCLLLLGSLCLAGGAQAQTAEVIQFDFTASSSFSLLGGTIVTPPDGTVDVGYARVTVDATAPSVYVPGGQVLLEQVALGGTVDKDVAGQADVSGTYSALQSGSLAGTLAPGGTGIDFVDDLMLNIDITLGCTGSGCGVLGLPTSELGLQAFTVSFLPITNLDVPGSAQISAVLPIEVGGLLGELTLIGVESNRFFVPEPGTFLLVGLGLAGLAHSRRGSRRAL